MAKRIVDITVDLNEKDYNEVILKQLDTTRLIFSVLKDNQQFDLTGLNSNVSFVKPNGSVVIQNAIVDTVNKQIICDLLIDCVRDYGRGKVEVELLENEEVLSSFQVSVKIEKSGRANMPSADGESYIEAIERLMNQARHDIEVALENTREDTRVAVAEILEHVSEEALETVEDTLQEAVDNANESALKTLGLWNNTYSNTSTYEIGDTEVYNHKLYECIVQIVTPESFNENKWREISFLEV